MTKGSKKPWIVKRRVLALVHKKDSVKPKFDATFGGSIDEAGQALLNCAIAADFGKNTHLYAVHLAPDEIENNKAPVRSCYRYLSNRKEQLDYKGAIEKGLPIGSGEIESAHSKSIEITWCMVDNR